MIDWECGYGVAEMKHLQLAFLLATLLVASGGDSRAENWRSYHNTRFGTAADVPASWTTGPEPTNDDGRKFMSPDKHAEITISGIFANADTDDELASRLEAGVGETIKFKKRQGRWVVVSGTKGDRIFYRKTLLSCGDSIANDLWIEYPAAEKQKYGALVAHVAASLRPSRGYGMTTKCR
jgi:serine/threonine-protein kinase